MIKIEFRFSLSGFCVTDFNRNLLILLSSCVQCLALLLLSAPNSAWESRVHVSLNDMCLPVSMEVSPATLQCYVPSKTSCDLLENCDAVLVLPYDVFNIRGFFFSVVAVIAALMKAGCASFPCESYISQTCFALYELLVETTCILVKSSLSVIFFLSCDLNIYFR